MIDLGWRSDARGESHAGPVARPAAPPARRTTVRRLPSRDRRNHARRRRNGAARVCLAPVNASDDRDARSGAAGHRTHGRAERAHPGVERAHLRDQDQRVSSILWAVWAAGAALCLLPLSRWHISRVAFAAKDRHGESHTRLCRPGGVLGPVSIPILLHDSLSSPVACGILSSAIALPTSSRVWSALDVERAVAHELAHVGRADVLVHALARAICAAYWFHPLVWKCSRTLRLEAERACDDEVAGQFDSTDYAAQLVRLARGMARRDAWTSLPTMATPGELAIRVQALLDGRATKGASGPEARRADGPVGSGVRSLAGVPDSNGRAYRGRAVAAHHRCFPPHHVRESSPGESMALVRHPDGSVRITAAPLRVLIRLAYGVQDQAIVDAPAWMASTRFSIDATPPANAERADATVVMLRSLLADRFALRVVQALRAQRVFVLRGPARGSVLRPATPCVPRRWPHPPGRLRRVQRSCAAASPWLQAASMPRLSTFTDSRPRCRRFSADRSSSSSTRADRFDLRLRWPATDSGVATLIDALRTQAGLVVSEQQRRVPVLAIQSARRPT